MFDRLARRSVGGILGTAAALGASALLATSATAIPLPSGERILGNSSIEPAYDAATGQLMFLSTPTGVTQVSNEHSIAPLYIVVYPSGSGVGTLNCMGVPGNCPDHDGEVAGAAAQIMSGVYGNGVIGHDHVADAPGGSDWNVEWIPVLVLFTNADAATHHLTTDAEIQQAVDSHNAIEVPFAAGTFHCARVAPQVYWNGSPV